MKKLAVIVTRGAYNNLLQACELVRIAAASGTQVSMLFRDEAAAKLTHDKVKQLTFSDGYRGRESRVREVLSERKLDDLPAILREIKGKGDAKFSVCRDSIEYFDLRVEQLIPELDEVQRAEAFWKEEVAQADQVVTF
ncbi:MAG: DsrE family protein [Nitrospirae bacterium]|nr:DsrE family protein [Nitrospirota bacterium]